jgi:hypothetical protein
MMNVDILYLLDKEISVDPSCGEDIDGRQLETEMPHDLALRARSRALQISAAVSGRPL